MSIHKQLLYFTLMMVVLPLSVQAVELTETDNGSKISVSEGEAISLALTGNPTTGYLWELVSVDRDVLAAGAEPVFTADSSLTGSGGKFKFRFTPLKTGSTAIKLIYHRPWEKDQKPIHTFQAYVSVSADKPQINSASYRSAMGEVVKASFDLKLDQVTISLPDGRNLTLHSAPSDSGARYSNGNETFWEHQGVGRFLKEDTLIFEGTVLRNNDKNQKQ
jgi:predicted secreted protein/membrane-bound inhibitor of C-type lysozyme